MREVFTDGPFASPVIFKVYGKKHHDEIGGQWALRDTPVVLRRFPEYFFEKGKNPVAEMKRLESAYRRFGSYEYLRVPRFQTIRANVFGETDKRLKSYYVMAEEIQGKNLQDLGMLQGSKREEAIHVFNHAYQDFVSYARSLYETGGVFDADQMTHNYVYGKGWHDDEPRLYSVDLELKGLREYHAENRERPQNYDYFEFIVGGINGLIANTEQYIVGTELSLARDAFRTFIGELSKSEITYQGQVHETSNHLFQP